MSLLVYAPFSFHIPRRLRHSILSDMDLTPTNSDDKVKELSETLQSMPSPSKPPETKQGRIAKYIRLEILILALCLKLL